MLNRWSRRCVATVSVGLALAFVGAGVARGGDDLLPDLQKAIDAGDKPSSDLLRSIRTQIEANPKGAAELLLPKLRDAHATEAALVTYVWAVGLTELPETADDLIAVANTRGKDSPQLLNACWRALANAGGPRSGAFLLAQLDSQTDSSTRFELLNLLAQRQYEPALPKMLEVLGVDQQEYWKPMFVFGKLGDVGVPFLLKHLDSDQRNVRFNTIFMLKWLLASDAAATLQARFWKEEDPELRLLVLGAIEGTVSDAAALRQFSNEVLAKEKADTIRQFAQEILDGLTHAEEQGQAARAAKRNDRSAFQRAYDELYHSSGKEGNLEALFELSVLSDEPQLKRLRERVLRRNSDEAFYDFEKINVIILNNRHIYGSAAATQSAPAAQAKP